MKKLSVPVVPCIIISLFVVPISGCEYKKGGNVDISRNIYKDEYKPRKIRVNLSDSVLNVDACGGIESFIILDSTELIGKIDKIQVVGERIYILDKKRAKALFCFSIYGKLLWKYGRNGRGRGKLLEPGDMHVQKNGIYILDNTALKILQIDSLGLFVKEMYLGKNRHIFPDELYVDTNRNIILHNFDMGDHNHFPFKMAVMDPACKNVLSYHLEKSTNPPVKRWGYELSPLQYLESNNGFYYTEAMNDTIYSYENGTFFRKYFVDFGANRIPDRIKSKKTYTLDNFYKSSYVGNIERIAESDSLVSFMFGKGYRSGYAFLDKQTLKCKSYALTVFNIDKYYQMLLPIGSWNGRIIASVNPIEIIRFCEYYKKKHPGLDAAQFENLLKKEMPLLYILRSRISPTANPILVLITLSRHKLFYNENA